MQFVALAIFLFFPFKLREISVKGFDAEAWMATGAINTGLPLLLTLWVIRIAGLLEDRKEPEPQGDTVPV